ncbi:MAG TPA: sulfotransferase [Candidatus Latescibacteria bacterium]|nr:sulfotransferase [Candidatus Latescibacterota bacterium]HJP29610.1 sulfotransferase [Candidatus Latescibacterota bacterium]
MSLITIIGRGHSGTRAISHTLYASGVFMGSTINRSGDKVPPADMYEAARVFARHVPWKGDLEWDFESMAETPIDPEYERLVGEYLSDVHREKTQHKGWKLPETTLSLPWITRMYPEAYYIYLVRDPRDSILGGHTTDDLARFDVRYPETDDTMRRRAISWKYQYDLVAATPKPERWLTLRFEDFVLHQERELGRLEEFLGFSLGRIIVRPDAVGRWRRTEERVPDFDFLRSALDESGYDNQE